MGDKTTEGSSGPITRLVQGQRRAADTSAVEAAGRLAMLLDKLVQTALRSRGAEERAIPEVFEAWSRRSDIRFELEPTRLVFQGAVVLQAGDEAGRWLMPAYGAGLRRIGIRLTATEADLLRFVRALADLHLTVRDIRSFRDWIWAGGAGGFSLDQDPLVAEGPEVIFLAPEPLLDRLGERGRRAAEALGPADRRLDEGALDASADPIQKALNDYEHPDSLPEDRLRRLRRAVDDPLLWFDAALRLARQDNELTVRHPPERLAGRYVAALARTLDPRLLEVGRRLVRPSNAYEETLADLLGEQKLGRSLADAMSLRRVPIGHLATFLKKTPADFAGGLLAGLLGRCVRDRLAFAYLQKLLQNMGLAKLYKRIPVASLEESAAVVLGLLMFKASAPLELLQDLVDRIPREAVLPVLERLPSDILGSLRASIRTILCEDGHPEVSQRLIELLLGLEERRWQNLVGEVLVETGGKGWPLPVVRQVGENSMKTGMGETVLVALAHKREAPAEARIMALDLLEQDPLLLEKAAARRMSEMLDPPAVRERIKQLRKKGGG